jgi:hypothetical protein
MHTPEELKQHILHPDRWVRRAVLDYFYGTWSQDRDLAHLALEAHHRFHRLGEFPNLDCLQRFPIDETTAGEVLALLEATPSRIARIHLNWCISSFPLDILRKLDGRIEGRLLDEESREKVRLRRKLGELSDEKLWLQFLELTGRANMRTTPMRRDRLHTDPLIDELSSRAFPGGEEICELLGSSAYDGTYFERLLVELAGARKLRESVPYLIRKMEGADEFEGCRTVDPLVRIADPVTIALILLRWNGLLKTDAVAVLGHFPDPDAEEALLLLFEEEDDPDVRLEIAHALCELFSSRAVEPVRMVLRETSYDLYREFRDIKRDLLPVIDLLGIDLPEAAPWRKDRDEEFARSPSVEKDLTPEELELHRNILKAAEDIDRAKEEIGKVYDERGNALLGPETAEDEDDE